MVPEDCVACGTKVSFDLCNTEISLDYDYPGISLN